MSDESSSTWSDRLAAAFFGALTGFGYGVVLAALAGFFRGAFQWRIVVCAVIAFAVIGLVRGNALVGAFLSLAHWTWAFFSGSISEARLIDEEDLRGPFKWVVVIGFVTGLVLLI